ncbi:uncharacterized protein LOC115883704 [Sitophilus oryzae]|uniref:Uncharacterized protein LOC115883704 n=1 Tax=Sitophilus oryzae TaxID=7048 RepID=A0A6J2Y4N0_SITOR|nr:uncharacterized protein LOC115883704 [Sitophilus oryzae]
MIENDDSVAFGECNTTLNASNQTQSDSITDVENIESKPCSEEHKNVVESLKREFSRIADLAKHESCNTELIKKFVGSLRAINRGSQLDSFLASKQRIKRKTKLIKVHPTARSRERYKMLKWGDREFKILDIAPIKRVCIKIQFIPFHPICMTQPRCCAANV